MRLTKRWQLDCWHDYKLLGNFRFAGIDVSWVDIYCEFSVCVLGLHVMATYWRGEHPERMGDGYTSAN